VRSLFAELPALNHDDAQTPQSKLARHRQTNRAPADDDRISRIPELFPVSHSENCWYDATNSKAVSPLAISFQPEAGCLIFKQYWLTAEKLKADC
jgi:hypothetical protein